MASTQTNGVHGNHNGHGIQAALHDMGSASERSVTEEGERRRALLAAYALVARLETPWEFVARFCMGQVSSHTSLPLPTLSGHVSLRAIFSHHLLRRARELTIVLSSQPLPRRLKSAKICNSLTNGTNSAETEKYQVMSSPKS